jgi:hypothetical protein
MLLVAVTMWAGPVACLWMNESAMVFQAHRSRVRRPVQGSGLLELRTSGGFQLDALLFPYDGEAEYWILFCPPSGRTIHGYVLRRHLESLRAAGFNIFAFDYRGFGRNSGIPSETGLYEDALTAYRYLTTDLGVAPPRIILGGRSLGTHEKAQTSASFETIASVVRSPLLESNASSLSRGRRSTVRFSISPLSTLVRRSVRSGCSDRHHAEVESPRLFPLKELRGDVQKPR